MMKIAKVILTCVVLGAFVFMVAPARAEYGKEERGKKHPEMMEKYTQELGLTAEQKEALTASREAAKAQKETIGENLKAAREALKAELKKSDVDQAALNKAVADIKAAQGEIVDARVQSFLSMKGILTDEQFQKMSEMKKGCGKDGKKGPKGKRGDKDAVDEGYEVGIQQAEGIQ